MPEKTLWYVRESEKAFLYTRIPPERRPTKADEIWIPKSIVEGRTKTGNTHVVRLPSWFYDQNDL